ncbi:MAG: hypothetical protein US31_C0002G0113 [Berkelbacteria bacterium GW2011_GWA1_36_9]|uniref:Acyltransferase 3 domain-containing protein n=1 Tax=Berkelbacteria bacterium GW2011_GWA1_36_9 TaxID=1618331 RepID=A0A0G0FIA5_9BACT|nr:MAG: hypothetical protein US31_C0002G0113 [Berkelbacteria bacterium GW2011_GWA1_36_9]
MKKKNLKNKQQYFNSFDYLKVFFAISIVAWHTKALGPTSLVNSQLNLNLKEIIYGNLFLVAVPIFAQISLFLYIYNREIKKNYFWGRIFYLIILYLFWMALLIILFYAGNRAKLQTLEFWLSGGASPLYFLLVLVVTTIVMEVFFLLKKLLNERIFISISVLLLLISTLVLVFKVNLVNFMIPKYLPLLMSHWSPINFLPYVFSALLFFYLYQKNYFRNKNIQVMALITCFIIILIAYFEYRFIPNPIYLQYDGMIIPPYSRLSIILSTMLILYIFLNREDRPSIIVKKMSELTLGIYILHVFVMNLLAGFSSAYYQIIKNSVVYFGLVLLISLILTYLIKQKKII